MTGINLYVLDISSPNSISGVDRHIEKLIMGLSSFEHIRIYRVQLVFNSSMIMHREEDKGSYKQITFPLPLNYNEIIKERYWMHKYNKHILHIMKSIFAVKQNRILHLHTLNLIDLALLIKREFDCKIITHLHCIPWKDYYNTNPIKFNKLYEDVYQNDEQGTVPHDFITNNCEYDSYMHADHIISGTQCGVDFLVNTMGILAKKISIVHNGTDDYAKEFKRTYDIADKSSAIQCVFVANLYKSKGLDFILDALRIVSKKGYNVSLKIVGYTTPFITSKIKDKYSDLNIQVLGVQSFDKLANLYRQSDIGLIASLQEQWSFVGVEMAMFGLPIVTTAVDGLDEIFTDNENALKVSTTFNNKVGLSIDVKMMADKIMLLIEMPKLRAHIGKNARLLYEDKLELGNMIKQTISVYNKLIK